MLERPEVQNEISGPGRQKRYPRKRRGPRHIPLWQRILFCVVGAPFVVTGAASAAYYLQLHRVSEEISLADMPLAPKPAAHRRILVLSPHCDDETLGVGGQIAEARRAGDDVTVGFLTNGDGFRIAASRSLHELNVGPDGFVRFAEMRQQESLAALGELGVPSGNVKFLGYPDRGLKPMWESNWDHGNPFRSGFTGRTESPYARTYTPGAVYSGSSLVADLTRLMEETRPTDILVTHPSDDHPDHCTAAAFTEAALRACASRGDAWTRAARLHYYIVHRGDWPIPQGRYPDKPMLPPPGLITTGARWNVYPLTDFGREAKRRALSHYGSQLEISGRFLVSFLRTNELFTNLPTPAAREGDGVGTGIDTVSGTTADEGALGECETASANLYGDNLARYVEPSADITEIAVSQTGPNLRVRLQTRGRASRDIRYTVLARSWQTGHDGKSRSTIVSVPVALDEAAVAAGADPNALTTSIPLSSLGLDTPGTSRSIFLSAESRLNRRLPAIDRTGYREFTLPDRIASASPKS